MAELETERETGSNCVYEWALKQAYSSIVIQYAITVWLMPRIYDIQKESYLLDVSVCSRTPLTGDT